MSTEIAQGYRLLERLGLGLLVLRECLGLYGGVLSGRRALDVQAMARELRSVGLAPLPVLTVIAAAIGLIIGIQTGRVLEQVNLAGVLVDAVAVGVVREFAPLLVGIFVAGRTGVALSVRLATMRMNRELDGLAVSGVNPVHFTVAPTLLAMLVMAIALAVWVALVMIGFSALYLDQVQGLPWPEFRQLLMDSLGSGDLVQGVVKPVVFVLLVALIAAVNGATAPRTSGVIAQAAATTMMSALAVILVVDLLFVAFA